MGEKRWGVFELRGILLGLYKTRERAEAEIEACYRRFAATNATMQVSDLTQHQRPETVIYSGHARRKTFPRMIVWDFDLLLREVEFED